RSSARLERLPLPLPRRYAARAQARPRTRGTRRLANGSPQDRAPAGEGARLQLEDLLGELQRVPALPGHPPGTVRHGAYLPAGRDGRERGTGLEQGDALRSGAEGGCADLDHVRGPVWARIPRPDSRAAGERLQLRDALPVNVRR